MRCFSTEREDYLRPGAAGAGATGAAELVGFGLTGGVVVSPQPTITPNAKSNAAKTNFFIFSTSCTS